MKPLTQRQRMVLDFIRTELEHQGRPPTLHEIKNRFGWSSTNAVRGHLKLLRAKGALTCDRYRARGIRLPPIPSAPTLRAVPLLGQVPAGMPLEAVEHHTDTINIDPAMFPGEDLFALRVRGDSMTDAGILEGDTLIVRRQPAADPGAIVVATINGEATVKRLLRRNGHWLL
ncbi:MAG: transcriptional repressor LexA, partial [Kiritimatiellia bacterium]